MDGQPWSGNAQRPFMFSEWLQGVNDGRNPKDAPQNGILL